MNFSQLIAEMLKPGNMIAPIVSALHAIIFGLWLIAPAKSFISPSYDAMAGLAPEFVWGFSVLLVGCFALYFSLKGSDRAIAHAFGALFTLWLFVTVSFALGSLATTAIPTYFCISIFMGLNYLSVRKKMYDEAHLLD